MSTEDYTNPLICPVCKEYQYLIFKKMGYTEENIGVGYNLPFFRCEKCDKESPVVPINYIKSEARKHILEMKTANVQGYFSLPILGENKRFEKYNINGFNYDARDYYFVPGLRRAWNEGFLTPVFFDKDLLLYYNNHPEYSVVLQSFSNVVIYKGNEALLPYGLGINRNGKLFAWLGDLHPFLSAQNNKKHLHLFLASNVESDHDLFSDYYLMQIEARVVESNNEMQIFRLKNRFEEMILQKFGFKIFKFNIDDLRNDYRSPIMDEKIQVFDAYEGLDKLINENINEKELKRILKDVINPEDLENKRSLKLLELFFEHKLKIENSDSVISSLFIVHDLRILKAHLTVSSFDEKYTNCKRRLEVDDSLNYIDFFEEVVKSIIEMFNTVNERLEGI